MKIVSIGEVLWDVIGDKEHLGGAPLNFAAHARKLGHEVDFVSAVGRDERGERVLGSMERMGLSTRFVRRVEGHPTGVAAVSVDADGQPKFKIHRPAAYDFPQLTADDLSDLLSPRPDWIYFGTLLLLSSEARAVVEKLFSARCGARRFYDVNLRPGCYDSGLVHDLMGQTSVAKLNREELVAVDRMLGRQHRGVEDFCREYARYFGWEGVCVTCGSDGCALLLGNEFVKAQGYSVNVADTVGAGDAFAAAFIHGLASGWPPQQVADFANRVGALVASRAGAIPGWTVEEARSLRRV